MDLNTYYISNWATRQLGHSTDSTGSNSRQEYGERGPRRHREAEATSSSQGGDGGRQKDRAEGFSYNVYICVHVAKAKPGRG